MAQKDHEKETGKSENMGESMTFDTKLRLIFILFADMHKIFPKNNHCTTQVANPEPDFDFFFFSWYSRAFLSLPDSFLKTLSPDFLH